jgi:Holliday junction resolvasome RuvABC endonuclease subunit
MGLNYLKKTNVKTVLSIDPASHSLAWSITEYDNGIKVIKTDKITFAKGAAIEEKFNAIKLGVQKICEQYNPQVCVIEQSVYIQNFQTSRLLSYIIGFTWGIASLHCESVMDVSPLVWRSGVGYKNLTAKDKEAMGNDGTKRNIELKKKEERKKRVRIIIQDNFVTDNIDLGDDDIVDAVGIGLWYWKVKVQNGK